MKSCQRITSHWKRKIQTKKPGSMEQEFVFPTKVVVINEQIQRFFILRAPSSLHELKTVLDASDESCSGFHQSRLVTIASTTQDVWSAPLLFLQKAWRHKASRESDPVVEDLRAWLANISHLVKKDVCSNQYSSKGFSLISSNVQNISKCTCSYRHKPWHDIDDHWKNKGDSHV